MFGEKIKVYVCHGQYNTLNKYVFMGAWGDLKKTTNFITAAGLVV